MLSNKNYLFQGRNLYIPDLCRYITCNLKGEIYAFATKPFFDEEAGVWEGGMLFLKEGEPFFGEGQFIADGFVGSVGVWPIEELPIDGSAEKEGA